MEQQKAIRDQFTLVRLTSDEKRLLRRLSRLERRSLSETLRVSLKEEGRRRGLWPTEQGSDRASA